MEASIKHPGHLTEQFVLWNAHMAFHRFLLENISKGCDKACRPRGVKIRQRTRQPIHGLEAEAAHLHQGISMMLNGIQRVKFILVAVAYQVVEHLWRNRRRCIAELCNDFPLKLRLFQSGHQLCYYFISNAIDSLELRRVRLQYIPDAIAPFGVDTPGNDFPDTAFQATKIRDNGRLTFWLLHIEVAYFELASILPILAHSPLSVKGVDDVACCRKVASARDEILTGIRILIADDHEAVRRMDGEGVFAAHLLLQRLVDIVTQRLSPPSGGTASVADVSHFFISPLNEKASLFASTHLFPFDAEDP